MPKSSRPYLIGALLLSLAIVAVTGAFKFASFATAGNSQFCAEMPDALGLYVGNPVTQMGYEVGRVEEIEPRGGHVEITFSLAEERSFPADVRAVTRSKSLLADRSLELVGNYSTGETLQPGSCIPVDHSHTPKSISEIAGSAADFIDELAPNDGNQSVQKTVDELAKSLRGEGENARQMMNYASGAAADPDKLVADIGSAIQSMAPLTEDALQNWNSIKSIVEQMPEIVAAGPDLWPGVIAVCEGIVWLVATLDDIQKNYGTDIWSYLHGRGTESVKLGATQSKDLAKLISSIPAVTPFLVQQSSLQGGLTMVYDPPTVELDAANAAFLCPLIDSARPGICSVDQSGSGITTIGLLDVVLIGRS
ncbi:MlaD family protein [Rhodococcus sp. (in: high G+C Gram-positive bacteria)]|uniref:MlaD family protein n=1 Tax=Rhodococcus sp. TaxID=1831 RepID=UPI00257F1020|nr:MlaD family protein [Rhodococcus sp. (in: high G+C Gram-positive bacteria)]MBQ9055203.1 MCE family protein [Rhodococcus sp. (in: high G+C Gram-positive bacteria)]